MAFWNKKASAVSERDAKVRHLLDAVSFDTSGWQFDGEDFAQMVRQWVTPHDDLVSLNFFSRPPDLPTTGDLADFEAYTKELLAEVEGRLVEQQIRPLAQMSAVRQIIKVPIPDQAHGLIYVGSWILPFEKFSYVLKVQCVERGITGTRESILLATARAGSANRRFEGDKLIMPDWNPDASEFDEEFAYHPVSRARRVLEHLQTTTQITAQLRVCAPFPLPAPE